MIALQDCLGLCQLTEAEIDAICEHEHIPELAAAALAEYLMHSAHGPAIVRDMIRDDIRAAIAEGDGRRARQLVAAFAEFLRAHPEAALR
ncbi:MAG: hypothetical protein ACFCUS_04050 [Rubrimonas sp.]|uniref:hypothetical protein n=1 Tax=Rubrimonas sp. TaxID=2036015 RepID=UPI002FDD639C